MKNADRIASIVLLLIAIYFFAETRKFTSYGALFPQVIAVVLGVLAALLFVLSFVKPKEGRAFASGEVRYLTIGISVAIMAAWAVMIGVLGFYVTSLLLFSVMVVYLDRKKTWRSILRNIGLVGALVTAFYFFFVKVLMVPCRGC